MKRVMGLWFLGLLLVSGRAWAAEDESEDRQTERRFQEGMDLIKQGKPDEARSRFQQAYALHRAPKILFNLALAERDSGHPLDALRHFKLYVQDARAQPERVALIRKEYLPLLMGQTAHVRLEAPAGSEVRVDDDPTVDKAPLADAIDLLPGPHTVEAAHQGQKESRRLEIGAGQTMIVRLLIAPDKEVPAVESEPTESRPSQGSSFWTAKNTIVVGLVTAGLVAAGVGVGFGIASSSAQGDVDAERGRHPGACLNPSSPECSARRDLIDSQRADSTVAGVMYASAGALLAGAAAVWLFVPSKANKGAWVLPAVGVRSVGASAGLSF